MPLTWTAPGLGTDLYHIDRSSRISRHKHPMDGILLYRACCAQGWRLLLPDRE